MEEKKVLKVKIIISFLLYPFSMFTNMTINNCVLYTYVVHNFAFLGGLLFSLELILSLQRLTF